MSRCPPIEENITVIGLGSTRTTINLFRCSGKVLVRDIEIRDSIIG